MTTDQILKLAAYHAEMEKEALVGKGNIGGAVAARLKSVSPFASRTGGLGKTVSQLRSMQEVAGPGMQEPLRKAVVKVTKHMGQGATDIARGGVQAAHRMA